MLCLLQVRLLLLTVVRAPSTSPSRGPIIIYFLPTCLRTYLGRYLGLNYNWYYLSNYSRFLTIPTYLVPRYLTLLLPHTHTHPPLYTPAISTFRCPQDICRHPMPGDFVRYIYTYIYISTYLRIYISISIYNWVYVMALDLSQVL